MTVASQHPAPKWTLRRIAIAIPYTVASLFLILTMLHIVVNALSRTLLQSPLWATNEFITYWYMPALCLTGFVLAQLENEQVEARLIFDKLPRKNQIELQAFAYILVIVLCAGVCWYTWQEAMRAYGLRMTGGIVGLTMWPVTFLVPLSFGLMVLVAAADLLRVIRRRQLPEEWRHTPDKEQPHGH